MAATELQLRESNNRMVADASAKLVHIILQSRVVFSSGLFPTKDCDAFNLEIKLEHDVRTKISSWRQSVGAVQNPAVPMAVDIYHTAPATPLTPRPEKTLLEHWTLLYEPHLGGNRRAMDKKRSLLQTAVMVRAVYSFLYVVPTADIVTQTRRHRGYGKLDFAFSSNPTAHPFDTDDIETLSFGGIETEFGTLLVDVIYRRDCSDLVDSSFLNSSVHYSSAAAAGGRPRTASGLGLGHLLIDDDYEQAVDRHVSTTQSPEEAVAAAPVRKGTRPRTISLPQKPELPGKAGSYPQSNATSADRTMPQRPPHQRKSVGGRTWAELSDERQSTPQAPLGETEVLYSRPPPRQHSSVGLPQREGSVADVATGQGGQGGEGGQGSGEHGPVLVRRAETTPSVYLHALGPAAAYERVLAAGEAGEAAVAEAEESPFPRGFFVDATEALESSRLVQRSLVDGGKGERRHVDWADLHSDVSWGTAPAKGGAGPAPSVSPFKDAPMAVQSALLRSRSLPKPSTDTAPLWASCVVPSEKRTAPKPRPPRPPLSVSVSMEEEIASFIEACSSAPRLDMCAAPLSDSGSHGSSSSGQSSSGWQGVERHHERLRQLRLFAEELQDVRRTPYGTT